MLELRFIKTDPYGDHLYVEDWLTPLKVKTKNANALNTSLQRLRTVSTKKKWSNGERNRKILPAMLGVRALSTKIRLVKRVVFNINGQILYT